MPPTPQWSYNQQYYSRLIDSGRLVVRTDPLKGKGLFTQQRIAKDECILAETALFCAQNLDDFVRGIPVCAMCLVSLESVRQCVRRASGSADMALKVPMYRIYSHRSSEKCRLSNRGCTAKFCSPRCRELAWDRFHSVSCVGAMSSAQRTAWDAFITGSWEEGGVNYSDTVALAFRFMCQAVAASRSSGRPLKETFEPAAQLIKTSFDRFHFVFLLSAPEEGEEEADVSEDEKRRRKWREFQKYKDDLSSHPYVQAASTSNSNNSSTSISGASKQKFVEEGHRLVSEILDVSPEDASFFTPQVWSELLGATLLNSQERSPPSAYSLYRECISAVPSGVAARNAFEELLLRETHTDVASCEQSSHGQGVYPVGCLFNHSCDPNAMVAYNDTDDESIRVLAMRDIDAGEELVISYIDESMPYEERQQQLLEHYLFACRCTKCVAEEASVSAVATSGASL